MKKFFLYVLVTILITAEKTYVMVPTGVNDEWEIVEASQQEPTEPENVPEKAPPASDVYAEWELVDLDEGQSYLRHIYTGQGDIVPHQTQAEFHNTLRAIVWYLYSKALQKNCTFEEGTFVIEDPNSTLFNFLKNTGYAYKRPSSHFQEYQQDHYGVSLEGLPGNKRHILFGKLDATHMYLKPENYGLEIAQLPGHTMEYIVAQMRKIELVRKFCHLTPDTAEMYRKEHLDPLIYNDTIKLINEFEPNQETRQELIALIKLFGLKKIIPILENYSEHPTVAAAINTLKQKFPDWDTRKGNEVIFNMHDLFPSNNTPQNGVHKN